MVKRALDMSNVCKPWDKSIKSDVSGMLYALGSVWYEKE